MARSVDADGVAPEPKVAPDPTIIRDDVDEADKNLASLGYAPVSAKTLLP